MRPLARRGLESNLWASFFGSIMHFELMSVRISEFGIEPLLGWVDRAFYWLTAPPSIAFAWNLR